MGNVGAGRRQVGVSLDQASADWLRDEAHRLSCSQGSLVEAGLVLLRAEGGDGRGATADALRIIMRGRAERAPR